MAAMPAALSHPCWPRFHLMPRLLAIDTSTDACSVALSHGTEIVEQCVVAPREHMLRLLPMVDELLARQGVALGDLDAIAFGRGPGSFTGLRICLGVVQGLAFGAGLPVIPVSTLAALAQGAVETRRLAAGSHVLAALDARMNEVYWGWFRVTESGLVEAAGEERVSPPEALAMIAGVAGWHGVGSGWSYRERIALADAGSIDAAALPRAGAVARLALPLWQRGETVAAEQALPVYLRDDVAWPKVQT